MAWVRIHDGAMSHPKILKLSDAAFRLWVKGLSYTQTHLTDGELAAEALDYMCAKRAAIDQLLDARLWVRDGAVMRIHDYLNWNDSRQDVLRKRSEARDRATKSRTRASERAPHVPSGVGTVTTDPKKEKEDSVPSETTCDPDKPLAASVDNVPPVSDPGERAAAFLEGYQRLFAQHSHGAQYYSRPSVDFQKALDLCAVWDHERLMKLAAVFLASDDPFIASSNRSVPVFASRASWADTKLREWEARRTA